MSLSRSGGRVALALVVACWLASCSSQTAILLRITSPLAVPAQIDGLTVHIRGETTGTVVDRSYPITAWPNTLSLRPGPMESSRLTITVTGTHAGVDVVTRVVHVAFVSGSDQVVEVVLPADCVGVVCPDGIDCSAGRCVTDTDAGIRDGGMDVGPVDGGPPDAGMPDTGPGDSGCGSDAACDDSIACTHDTCEAGACVHTPDDALCATGSTCSETAGCPPRVCADASECQDGNYCNGMELCTDTACAPGTSPCDDADGCSTDVCDEAADSCAHTTRDADMDGAGDATCTEFGGVPATDCDDGDADIGPSVPDACDGIDNDCNGVCDQSSTCCRGASGSCTTTCGSTGSRVCGASCSWSVCSPPPEICNGIDDDCNSACDDGFACCAGATTSCTTTCGSTGTHVCQPSCTFGAVCTPPAETCNGIDDNCNAMVDEGFTCSVGATRPCTATCGSTGVQTCDPFCAWGACVPPAEVCNTVDDNCNGTIDEGCGACAGCPGAIGVTGAGGQYDSTTGTSTQTGSCGGAGSEYTLTFTTTAIQDVFITTHGATVDTVVYVRACGCSGSEVACNNDADGRTSSQLHLTNLAAGTYQVFVDTASSAVGTAVPVQVYISAPAAESERCGNPTLIPTGTTTINGDTCGFVNDYASNTTASCSYVGTGLGSDRVYYFYLPTSRTVSVQTCNSATLYDTTLYVRNVCTDTSLTSQRFCDDDGCSGAATCTAGLHSSFSGTLGPGLFYLYVDGYDPTMTTCACGAYRLTLSGI
jgi:hypothetical protein